MVKRITVQGVRRPEPDVRSFVLALVELARQTTEPNTNEAADAPLSDEPSPNPTPDGSRNHNISTQ